MMVKEIIVLGGNDSVDKVLGDLRIRDVLAVRLFKKDPYLMQAVAVIYRTLNSQNLLDIFRAYRRSGLDRDQPPYQGSRRQCKADCATNCDVCYLLEHRLMIC